MVQLEEKKLCKCKVESCLGSVLLHEKELSELEYRKTLLRERYGDVDFELMDSPSSGEIFTKFYDLHVRQK